MSMPRLSLVIIFVITMLSAPTPNVHADGKLVRPRDYKGSLEEKAQEAIIIHERGDANTSAKQDMILKISVAGKVDQFAWVIPFPKPPKVEKADAKLFAELFAYVEARGARRVLSKRDDKAAGGAENAATKQQVEVISREVVGSYDVAVVKENKAGALNDWLKKEGYQTLDDAEDVIGFYRKKGYAFACIKVDEAQLTKSKRQEVDLHPLRFRFETGGRDGVYFPMKMTGLQSEPFDVNLYVFHRYWLNDQLNKFGYTHHGFRLAYRDWDTRQCKANGGKSWDDPKSDPLLRGLAHKVPTVAATLAKSHPGRRFYLTNIKAYRLDPKQVRKWPTDLWMFPFYTNRQFVPYDARAGGAASVD